MNSFDYQPEVADPNTFANQWIHATVPLWLAAKWMSSLGMIALGYALVIPWIEAPTSTSVPALFCAMMIYTAVASFVRIDMDADNFNRFLWRLHCALGPGRFFASTLNDTMEMLTSQPHLNAVVQDDDVSHEDDVDDSQCIADASLAQGGPVVELYSARFLKNNIE